MSAEEEERNAEYLLDHGRADEWAQLSFVCERVATAEARDRWEARFQANGGMTAEWVEMTPCAAWLYVAAFRYRHAVCIAVPVYATASRLGMAQGIRRFARTCPQCPLRALGPYLLAEACRVLGLRYLAVGPVGGFQHQLLRWARQLRLADAVSFSQNASARQLERLSENPWLARDPLVGGWGHQLLIRGVPEGLIELPSLDYSASVWFDPLAGRWLDEQPHDNRLLQDLSPDADPLLWKAIAGIGLFLFDGARVGALSPLAPAFQARVGAEVWQARRDGSVSVNSRLGGSSAVSAGSRGAPTTMSEME